MPSQPLRLLLVVAALAVLVGLGIVLSIANRETSAEFLPVAVAQADLPASQGAAVNLAEGDVHNVHDASIPDAGRRNHAAELHITLISSRPLSLKHLLLEIRDENSDAPSTCHTVEAPYENDKSIIVTDFVGSISIRGKAPLTHRLAISSLQPNEQRSVELYIVEPSNNSRVVVITDCDTGQPIAGARVEDRIQADHFLVGGRLLRSVNAIGAIETTDADGKFYFQFASSETHTLVVTVTGYSPAAVQLNRRSDDPTQIALGLRASGTVEGRILGRRGTSDTEVALLGRLEHLPPATCNIDCDRATGELALNATVDVRDSFRFDGIPQGVPVRLQVRQRMHVLAARGPYVFTRSARTEVVISLQSDGRIDGWVYDSVGRALPEVAVELRPSGLEWPGVLPATRQTDRAGHFSFEGLAYGAWTIVAAPVLSRVEPEATALAVRQATVVLEAGSPSQSVELSVSSAHSISGIVRTLGVEPTPASLIAQAVDGVTSQSVRTAPDGRFDLRGVPAGDYDLYADTDQGLLWLAQVPAGSSDLDLLVPSTNRFEIELVGPNGESVDDAEVQLWTTDRIPRLAFRAVGGPRLSIKGERSTGYVLYAYSSRHVLATAIPANLDTNQTTQVRLVSAGWATVLTAIGSAQREHTVTCGRPAVAVGVPRGGGVFEVLCPAGEVELGVVERGGESRIVANATVHVNESVILAATGPSRQER